MEVIFIMETSSLLYMGRTCLTACGSTTRRKPALLVKPRAEAASLWPLFTAFMPALSVPATATENMTEKVMTATAMGGTSDEAKMIKFTISSTTMLGMPSMSLQMTPASAEKARLRLLSTRQSPKPSAVPKTPESAEISSVTPRPRSIIFQRSSRMKVFSKLSASSSRRPASLA